MLALLCLVACDEASDQVIVNKVTSVSLSQSELSLTVGESHLLTVNILPEDAADKSVTWSSSDASVVTVSSSGLVEAIGAGSATVTVVASGKIASCLVTVKQKGGGMYAGIDLWEQGDQYDGTVN